MTNDTTTRKPLRLWPGVVLAIAIVLLYITAPMAFPEVELPVGMFGALAGAVLILAWWLLFSRAPWAERLGAVVSMVIATLIAKQLAHPSVQGAGQGMIDVLPPRSGPDARTGGVGSGRSEAPRRRALCGTRCGHRAVVDALSDRQNRGCHELQQPWIRAALAMDPHSGGTSSRTRRGRPAAAASRAGRTCTTRTRIRRTNRTCRTRRTCRTCGTCRTRLRSQRSRGATARQARRLDRT